MTWQNSALALAGVIGSFVAVFHGILTQRLMIAPIEASFAAGPRTPGPVRRLVPLLLQFTTFNWLLGGLALVAAAVWFGAEARLVTGLLVGSSYLFAAIGNFWGTRGRHPGWMLMAAALGLIAVGLVPIGG